MAPPARCLLLCLSLWAGSTLAATGPSSRGYTPLCLASNPSARPLAGGFAPAPSPNENSEAVQLAQQALQLFLRRNASSLLLSGCGPDAAAARATVLEACLQVVAGTRWLLTLRGDVPCASGAPRRPVVQAAAVVPLPYLEAPTNITILAAGSR